MRFVGVSVLIPRSIPVIRIGSKYEGEEDGGKRRLTRLGIQVCEVGVVKSLEEDVTDEAVNGIFVEHAPDHRFGIGRNGTGWLRLEAHRTPPDAELYEAW